MSRGGFKVLNLGCKVNRVEADMFTASLLAMGHAQVDDLGKAEVIIVNTCTVTAEADAKTRKACRHALRQAPEATLIVTGCSANLFADIYTALDSRVIVETDKLAVPSLAAHLLSPDEEPGDVQLATFSRIGPSFRSRAGIKVQDGCANACTYCIVHVARGPLWSRPVDDAVQEIRAAEEAGVREVVLTGINIGAHPELERLLSEALDRTSELRIRISSIEPRDVDDRLIELMASSDGRICRHLHLPLQAGCDRTLREMDRPYDTAWFAGLVDKLRAAMPHISLTTDVIAGFPGETDEAFGESLGFCQQMAFSKMHVFRYSPREGTPAAARVDQVPPEVKARRAARLRALSDTLREGYASSFIGCMEHVLLEESGGATAECYLSAARADGTALAQEGRRGALIPVKVVGSQGPILLCDQLA
ncbi:MAG: MiaB/RimO family radical SAM methylthiotransferase [Actinomycetota bacterium]|nr:MiaB/RimO family radical SAM methylthiotransferase [Actinomycetota bacterium]